MYGSYVDRDKERVSSFHFPTYDVLCTCRLVMATSTGGVTPLISISSKSTVKIADVDDADDDVGVDDDDGSDDDDDDERR